jgi:hypothetical protein
MNKREDLNKILNGFYKDINRHERSIKCECGGLTFGVIYNHKEAKIDLYCTSCDKLAHTRNVLWSPLENIQGDIIDLLKLVYKDNKKHMIGFVGTYLKAKKVQECNDMDLLDKAFEALYETFEKDYIIKK